MLAAHHAGMLDLPERFGAWGGIALRDPRPAEVDRLLDLGFAGVSLPAGALSAPAGLDLPGPVPARLAPRGAPLSRIPVSPRGRGRAATRPARRRGGRH